MGNHLEPNLFVTLDLYEYFQLEWSSYYVGGWVGVGVGMCGGGYVCVGGCVRVCVRACVRACKKCIHLTK